MSFMKSVFFVGLILALACSTRFPSANAAEHAGDGNRSVSPRGSAARPANVSRPARVAGPSARVTRAAPQQRPNAVRARPLLRSENAGNRVDRRVGPSGHQSASRGDGQHRGTRYAWGSNYVFWFYDGYYHGNCAWLRSKYHETGASYWLHRYRQCRADI